VRGVRGLGGWVGEHRHDGRDEPRDPHEAGEGGLVTDGIGEDVGRAPRNRMREKLRADADEGEMLLFMQWVSGAGRYRP